MPVLVGAVVTIPTTWLQMWFWNTLGMKLSYWDAFPLSAASVFLLFSLISVMSTDDPPEPADDLDYS